MTIRAFIFWKRFLWVGRILCCIMRCKFMFTWHIIMYTNETLKTKRKRVKLRDEVSVKKQRIKALWNAKFLKPFALCKQPYSRNLPAFISVFISTSLCCTLMLRLRKDLKLFEKIWVNEKLPIKNNCLYFFQQKKIGLVRINNSLELSVLY